MLSSKSPFRTNMVLNFELVKAGRNGKPLLNIWNYFLYMIGRRQFFLIKGSWLWSGKIHVISWKAMPMRIQTNHPPISSLSNIYHLIHAIKTFYTVVNELRDSTLCFLLFKLLSTTVLQFPRAKEMQDFLVNSNN